MINKIKSLFSFKRFNKFDELNNISYKEVKSQIEHSLSVARDMKYSDYNVAGLIASDLKLFIKKRLNETKKT